MSSRLALFICVGILAFYQICSAQIYQNFNVNEGVPSSEVYSVVQDSEKKLWISTDLGLGTFQGNEFKSYSTNDGLNDNCVLEAYPDSKGRIWVKSLNGSLGYFFKNKYYPLSCNDSIKKWLGAGVLKTLIFQDDTLFVSGIGPVSNLKIPYPFNRIIRQHVPMNMININCLKKQDCLLNVNFPEPPTSIKFTINGKQYPVHPQVTKPLRVCAAKLRDGRILLGTQHVLHIIDPNGTLTTRVFEKHIINLYESPAGDVWLAFNQQGAWQFKQGLLDSDPAVYLTDRTVTSVIEDHEGQMWFSTFEDGLYYLKNHNITNLVPDGKFDKIKVINLAKAGEKLIASVFEHGIFEVKKDNLRFKYKLEKHRHLQHMDMVVGIDSSTIVCGGGDGLFKLDLNTRKRTSYSSMFIKHISTTSQKNIILAASVKNFIKIDISSNKILDSVNFKQRIMRLCEDSHGRIFIGGYDGLFQCIDGVFKQIHPEQISTRISTIVGFGEGLLVGTIGQGAFVYENGKLTDLLKGVRDASKMVKSICSLGNLIFVGTNRGIYQFKKASNEYIFVKQYSTAQSFPSNEINAMVPWKDGLAIGTPKGILYFDFNNEKLRNTTFPVIIQQINADSISIDPTVLHRFKNSPSTLSFSVQAATFKYHGNIKYYYRLLGADSNWYYSNVNSIIFSGLGPGSYSFQIKAVADNGDIISKAAVFPFIIEKPFYATIWFKLFVSSFLLLVIAGITKFLLNRSRRRLERKFKYKNEKVDLELKALRAQMNPHFIFNSLNAIQSFVVKNDVKSAQQYLAKFSKLVRMVLNNSEHSLVTLDSELDILTRYIEFERLRFEQKFTFELLDKVVRPKSMIMVPGMLFQPFVENAIRHGLDNESNKEPRLTFKIEELGNSLLVSIEDNGSGIKPGINKTPEHISMGIKVTKDRLALLQKSKNLKSFQIRILNLSELSQNATGTRIEIELPINLN